MMHVRPWRIVRPKPVPRPAAVAGRAVLFEGDSAEVLRSQADNSVDAIVTDPPYALVSVVKRFGKPGSAPAKGNEAFIRSSRGFMGQTWDNGDTAHDVAFWRECWRVVKPGGFVLAFGGTRTYHRLACAIEDAGFEVRDMVQWLYGSGFPKSHDVSKGIDRAAGAEREVVGLKPKNGGGRAAPSHEGWQRPWMQEDGARDKPFQITAPATDSAEQWQGWGTALKPANEPICMARKPLSEGTVAANVLRWGTGAINIDGCRVGIDEAEREVIDNRSGADDGKRDGIYHDGVGARAVGETFKSHTQGRWPANVIHDGSDEVIAAFPQSSGARSPVLGTEDSETGESGIYNRYSRVASLPVRGDTGSAARFFYCSKASKKDRAGSRHPTVKPVSLMRYLCRLVTPQGGTVLDPFAGTGTTGEAAHLEGFKVIMIEREARFADDIRARYLGLNVELTTG